MARSPDRRCSFLLLLVLAVPPFGQARPAETGSTAIVLGQVVDGTTGRAMSGAIVTLGGRGLAPERVVVDAIGRFIFRGLPAGSFALAATKPGFFGGGAGMETPDAGARPVDVAAGQRVPNLTLKLWRFGAVSGSIEGEGRQPLAGVRVSAVRRAVAGGAWRFVAGVTTTSDDRGAYRIGGLAPGDYAIAAEPDSDPETPLLLAMLSANPDTGLDVLAGAMTTATKLPELDARVRRYPLTYFSDAAVISQATLVTIGIAEERMGVDVHLRTSGGTGVSGTLSGLAGSPENLVVHLVPADADAQGAPVDAATATCAADGHFDFSAVTPGRYVARVLQPPPDTSATSSLPQGPTWWASANVTVGPSAITRLVLQIHQGFRVAGRLTFAGSAPRPSAAELAAIGLRLDPVTRTDQPPTIWRGRVDATGRFQTMSVPPGMYVLRVSGVPPGWTVRRANVSGRDILDTPVAIATRNLDGVDLTLDNRPLAALTGSVRTSTSARVSAAVLVFPVDRNLRADSSADSRRIRLSRTGAEGTYRVNDLIDGDYFVLAVANVPPGWQDPKQLEAFERRAVRLTVESGRTFVADLVVTP